MHTGTPVRSPHATLQPVGIVLHDHPPTGTVLHSYPTRQHRPAQPATLTDRPLPPPPLPRHAERSCQFVLWQPFLDACAGGASADCCGVMHVSTRLSSSAPFSTCLCASDFWQVRPSVADAGQQLAVTAGLWLVGSAVS